MTDGTAVMEMMEMNMEMTGTNAEMAEMNMERAGTGAVMEMAETNLVAVAESNSEMEVAGAGLEMEMAETNSVELVKSDSEMEMAGAGLETETGLEAGEFSGVVDFIWAVAEARGSARPGWERNPKRLGEMAEAAFLARASRLGFGVAKPWGDSERFDFILHAPGNAKRQLWRVQVKSAHKTGEDGGYSIRAHGHSLETYTAAEIDLLVAYCVPEDAWYVFPMKEVERHRTMKLYPGSRRRRSKFEKFREAWGIVEGRGERPHSSQRRA